MECKQALTIPLDTEELMKFMFSNANANNRHNKANTPLYSPFTTSNFPITLT